MRIETGIYRLQVAEAFHQQAGADQQHHGKRHLPRHQQAAGAMAAASASVSPTAVAQNAVEVGPRDLQRWRQPETHAGEQRNPQRERQCREVHPDRLEPG